MNISRPTLRAALDQLQREGWIGVAHGKRRLILQGAARKTSVRANVIGLLTPLPLQQVPPFALFWLDRLRELLETAGYQLEIHSGRTWFGSRPERALESLVHQSPSAAWVIFLSNEAMQRWFVRRGLPCVLSGTCHPGIDLPSVDVDYRALCRHAAAKLLAHRHRRIALLIQNTGQAGDRESELGFREAFRGDVGTEAKPIIAHHHESADGIRTCLDQLLRQRPAPTAFLVAKSMPALTVLGYLMQRGLRIPQDAAVMARDDDHFLEFTAPLLARYRYDPDLHARRLFRAVMQVARGELPSRQQLRALPEFITGETIG